jgi:hypothetical protein
MAAQPAIGSDLTWLTLACQPRKDHKAADKRTADSAVMKRRTPSTQPKVRLDP